jgi:pyruvate-formate lyase-activating enzyme
VSFPYFPTVHTLEEIKGMAKALAKIDKDIPVTLIEYQPAFRLRDMEFIDKDDMKAALESIRSEGLRRVALQGGSGIPLAKDPLDLIVGSEEF